MTNLNEKMASLVRKDSLAWGITYVDLLEGRKWNIENRKWSVEPYQQVSPWHIEHYPDGLARKMSVMKPTQVGISTLALVKALHFADNWPVRIGYTLPRLQDTIDFATTRVDPMIDASKKLRDKLGQPNSSHAKRLGFSYLFFMEMTTEARMMPLDALFVDEYDLSDSSNLSTVINRMDASKWQIQINLSTPTLANYGIHNLYNHSDMRKWLVKCPKCGHDQELDWEKSVKIIGPPSRPTRVYYGCQACSHELTHDTIQAGRWVAEKPDLSTEHIGYHISQLMTAPADVLYKHFRDPETTTLEFYRKRLGVPYELGGGSITRDDILAACFDDLYDPEPVPVSRAQYYLGADQGNEIQVMICKLEDGKDIPEVVHIELIPMEQGFDRLAQLIKIYKIRKGVVDGSPNRHESTKMSDNFPGKILIADYTEQRDNWKTDKSRGKPYLNHVNINRTVMFDQVMKEIRDGRWKLPGDPSKPSQEVELVIDHVTALKRDIETRRTASGEMQVPVYRKLRADHLAHAWLYMTTAIEIDRGKRARIAVIGKKTQEEIPPDVKEEIDRLTEDIATLAEVPATQLEEFVKAGNDDYELPFPLSYKLSRLKERYADDEYIEPAIKAAKSLLRIP